VHNRVITHSPALRAPVYLWGEGVYRNRFLKCIQDFLDLFLYIHNVSILVIIWYLVYDFSIIKCVAHRQIKLKQNTDIVSASVTYYGETVSVFSARQHITYYAY